MAEDHVDPPRHWLARLPAGFAFGVATAAFQIEGAVDADGRGVSIWDTFARTPGRIVTGETGAVTCDHYHRWEEDLDLLADLGATAYRFSVAWPRVMPEGAGPVNHKGLDFYSRLVDGLLDRGIDPWVTLYHWDLPQPLEDTGGWLNRDTAARLADYTTAVVGALGDRVRIWGTVNEPFAIAQYGYQRGLLAPGRQVAGGEAFRAVHHVLLGHGLATEAIRATASTPPQVGLALDLWDVTPASRSAADRQAARRFDGWKNRVFTDPVLRGTYPDDLGEFFPGWQQHDPVAGGDLAVIAAPLDYLGVNYYAPAVIQAKDGEPLGVQFPTAGPPQPSGTTPCVPSSLVAVLTGLATGYQQLPPVVITENGSTDPDGESPAGALDDPWRVDYVGSHLRSLVDAIEAGVDVRGYFCWSLLDNFEWASGTSVRFGLVHVDFATLTRTPKTSFRWFGSVIGEHRARHG